MSVEEASRRRPSNHTCSSRAGGLMPETRAARRRSARLTGPVRPTHGVSPPAAPPTGPSPVTEICPYNCLARAARDTTARARESLRESLLVR